MPTNVEWLSAIKAEMDSFRLEYQTNRAADIAAFYAPVAANMQALADSLASETGLVAASLISTNTKVDQIVTLLLTWDQLLQDVRANLEFINTNGALNAQNQQLLQIASVGACCGDVQLPEGNPPDICARIQAVTDRVLDRANQLCAFADNGTAPSAEQLMDLYSWIDFSPSSPAFLSQQEAATLQGAIVSRGVAGLSAICDIWDNPDIRPYVLNLLYQAGSAASASAIMASASFLNVGIAAPWNTFLRYLFPASVIGLMYDDTKDVQAGNYDNSLCEEPEPEGHCNNQEVLIPEEVDYDTSFSWHIPPFYEGTQGDDFSFTLNSWDGPGGSVTLLSLPNETALGSVQVGETFRWTISGASTGAKAVFLPVDNRRNNFVQYTRCLHPAEPV